MKPTTIKFKLAPVLCLAFAILNFSSGIAPAQSLRGGYDTSHLYFATNGGTFTNYYWDSSLPAYTNTSNHGWMKTNTSSLRWEYYVAATLVATNSAPTNIWTGTNGTSVYTSYWATAGSPTTSAPQLSTNQPASSTNVAPQVLTPSVVAGGTNAPEGVYYAGKGSIYNQFDSTGTNVVQQWVKTTTAGNTGWSTNLYLTGASALPAANLTGTVADARLSNSIVRVIPFESFGAIGDAKELTTVSATAASAVITNAVAVFSAADVGKVALLYNDTTNLSYTIGTIASYTSPTQISLSFNSVRSWTNNGTLLFGSNNSNALVEAAAYYQTNNIIIGCYSNYLVSGALTLRNSAVNSIANITNAPASSITFAGYSKPQTQILPDEKQVLHGSTFIFISPPAANSLPSAMLSYSTANGLNQTKAINFENLIFWKPLSNNVSIYNCEDRGGAGYIDYCLAISDWATGWDTGASSVTWQPQSYEENTNTAAAFVSPRYANDGGLRFYGCAVYGWGAGYTIGEHGSATHCNAGYCGSSYIVDTMGGGWPQPSIGDYSFGAKNDISIFFRNTGGYALLDFESFGLEGHGIPTHGLYDPNNIALGRVLTRNAALTNFTSTGVITNYSDPRLQTHVEVPINMITCCGGSGDRVTNSSLYGLNYLASPAGFYPYTYDIVSTNSNAMDINISPTWGMKQIKMDLTFVVAAGNSTPFNGFSAYINFCNETDGRTQLGPFSFSAITNSASVTEQTVTTGYVILTGIPSSYSSASIQISPNASLLAPPGNSVPFYLVNASYDRLFQLP